MLVAGEASGDALGARLMSAMSLRAGRPLTFFGVGGPRMLALGFDSLFDMRELSVMGLAEILPRAYRLLARIGETAALAAARQPDILVTIDSPGFNFRLAGRLRRAAFPIVHYVAPQIWAWRQGRARSIAPLFDRMLALLPFEPPFFEGFGLPCSFVGHPVIEYGAGVGDGAAFRRRHGIAATDRLVAVLPGSRHSETSRLLPVFGETLRRLQADVAGLRVVLPTVPMVEAEVRRAAGDWPLPTLVLAQPTEKYDAFAAADAALAASGTVTLELALSRLPMLVAYRTSALTAALVRRLIRVPHVCLVNVLLQEGAIPEYLQGDCRPEMLEPALRRLLDDPAARAAQRRAADRLDVLLGADGPPPSVRAADAVLETLAGGRRAR